MHIDADNIFSTIFDSSPETVAKRLEVQNAIDDLNGLWRDPAPPAEAMELLGREIGIRKQIAGLLLLIEQDRTDAIAQATSAVESLKTEAGKSLVAAGFPEPTPAIIESHPTVVAGKGRLQSFVDYTTSGLSQTNQAAMASASRKFSEAEAMASKAEPMASLV